MSFSKFDSDVLNALSEALHEADLVIELNFDRDPNQILEVALLDANRPEDQEALLAYYVRSCKSD